MIVVTTPTGQIGSQVVDHLLASPATAPRLRLIARDPDRLPARVRENTEIVRGSHADTAVLREACEGADTLFWLVPPTFAADSIDGHFRAFTEPLRAVVGAGGVRRLVGVSSLGRGVAKNAGHISASLAMDEAVGTMDVHYRALCAPFLMENLLNQAELIRSQGHFALPLTPDRTLRTCATRDIAAMAAQLLADDTWTGQQDVPVVGPDDLSPDGIAQVLSEVLHQPVTVRFITPTEYQVFMRGVGASEGIAQAYADMMHALNTQPLYDATAPTTPDLAPTTFRAWCEEAFA